MRACRCPGRIHARRACRRCGGCGGQGGQGLSDRERRPAPDLQDRPFKIIPGQNEIGNRIIDQKPQVDGFITRIRPDLTYTNRKVPGVDVIHLHHGVWLNLGAEDATSPGFPERFVAAGEEKTIMNLPKGYGYASRGRQVAAEPHDPQPDARSDHGVHDL